MKLYISGKITGDPLYRKKFQDAALLLEKAGYSVVNPCDLIPGHDLDWNIAMRIDLTEMLRCDGVALLPDYKQSKGALIEARLAKKIGIKVRPVHEWLSMGNKNE